MKLSEFFGKFKSWSLWGNLAAMAGLVVLLALGVRYGLDIYTHHGESIAVPQLMHKKYDDAANILEQLHLKVEVIDTGYVKQLPPGCVLGQSPEPGERVKSGHVVYLTINAAKSPTITLPDVIDNSSLREAMAKLSAMGFKLTPPQFIPGEKDWVYGILVNGKHVSYGDKIPVDAPLTIQAGNGMRDENDSVSYVDPVYEYEDDFESPGTVDDFEEVKEPPTSPESPEPVEQKEPKKEAEEHKATPAAPNPKAEPHKQEREKP